MSETKEGHLSIALGKTLEGNKDELVKKILLAKRKFLTGRS